MVELLQERGLTITNEDALRSALLDNNYYRLSGYFRVYQIDPAHGDNRFHEGTKDTDFLLPYKLDRGLRSIIVDGMARLEVPLRSRFAYYAAQNGGAYTYLDAESYRDRRDKHGNPLRDGLLEEINKWLRRSSEVCIRHYRAQKRSIPLWAAVEALPFGVVSKMISLYADTTTLHSLYHDIELNAGNKANAQVIHSMVYLRNLCSHHSRLWNREMVVSTPVLKRIKQKYPDFRFEDQSVGSILVAQMYLVDQIEDDDGFSRTVRNYLDANPAYAEGIRRPIHWD
ncbi:Abi family protein [Bifidobacterium cuniculi]|nr:Abi family protein [Bifidobacterium cuniculi]